MPKRNTYDQASFHSTLILLYLLPHSLHSQKLSYVMFLPQTLSFRSVVPVTCPSLSKCLSSLVMSLAAYSTFNCYFFTKLTANHSEQREHLLPNPIRQYIPPTNNAAPPTKITILKAGSIELNFSVKKQYLFIINLHLEIKESIVIILIFGQEIYNKMQKDLLDLTQEQILTIQPNKCLNINIGVLGHVDSGKTSLCKILSQITSTASLDKNPQSQERGITLDLGFSAFFTRVPTRFDKQIKQQYFQFTLVDCPGHASLIKTIIGGAQIIDIMFLILDITKGIQAQTAECIIIAELYMKNIVIILNKIDLIEDPKALEAKTNALRKVFSKTKFGENVKMITFSTKSNPVEYNRKLKSLLLDEIVIPERNYQNKFLYLIDHCFKIKGKGTVITGTVIEGRSKPGDEIQICELQQKCKIKSMEMFRKPIQVAKQGDRVAMLMHHLQSDLVQRGIACTPGYLKKSKKCIIDLNLVRLYKRPIKNKTRFNIMSGHQTVQGQLRLFYSEQKQINLNKQYLAINEIDQNMIKQAKEIQGTKIFAILTFQRLFYANKGFKIIGYKPDIDNDEKACRIAFFGTIKEMFDEKDIIPLKLFKNKIKTGLIDRLVDNYSIIVKDLFDKETNIEHFIGKQIQIDKSDLIGKIQGGFGKSGKVKVSFKQSIEGHLIDGMEVSMKYIKWYQ